MKSVLDPSHKIIILYFYMSLYNYKQSNEVQVPDKQMLVDIFLCISDISGTNTIATILFLVFYNTWVYMNNIRPS